MTPANRRPSDPPITRRRVLPGSAAAPLALSGAGSAAAEPAARAAPPRPLRVLSYNIHYGQGMDGRYDVPRIAEVITKLTPDLVALQECDVGVRRSGQVNQVVELGRLTGPAARFAVLETRVIPETMASDHRPVFAVVEPLAADG